MTVPSTQQRGGGFMREDHQYKNPSSQIHAAARLQFTFYVTKIQVMCRTSEA